MADDEFGKNFTKAMTGDLFEAHVLRRQVEQTLPYRLLKPLKYDPQKSYPLVLFLHGAGECGTNNRSQLVHVVRIFYTAENREKFPCFVLAPQATGAWIGPTSEMTLQIIENLQKEFNIDMRRKYVIGLSMGGSGTWDLIARHPDMFAAAVPMCGWSLPNIAPRIAKVPVWAFVGANDGVAAATRTMIEALKKAGGTPRYTEYPNCGHNCWDPAIKEPDLLPWLFAQKRGG